MMTNLLSQFRNEFLDVWKIIRRSFPAQSIQFDALSSRKPLTYTIKVIRKKKKALFAADFFVIEIVCSLPICYLEI